jgi:cell division septum initiation protein DivIVA
MVDESFHLTSNDVRRYDNFGNALRGYDKEKVHQFRDQVADELERLARVNMDLEAKAKGFHEQLRAFRERDKALNDALVSAQQMSAMIREQAEREGQLIIREARAEGDRLLEEARNDIRRLETELEDLQRMRRQHLAQLRALAQRHLTDIEAADRVGDTPVEGTESVQEPRKSKAEPRPSETAKTPTWLDSSVPE